MSFASLHLAVIAAAFVATLASAGILGRSGFSSERPATRRVVSCEHVWKDIPKHALDLYDLGFNDQTINFNTLAPFAFVAARALDLTEYMNTYNSIKAEVNAANMTVADVAAVWNRTWANLGAVLEQEGEEHMAAGDVISAASSWQRAASVYQVAFRFSTVAESNPIARRAVEVFEKAVVLDSKGVFPTCTPVRIPFKSSAMHGYWCPADSDKYNVTAVPTLVALNGFDSTAEMFYKVAVAGMHPRGYNVLVMEGPGQASTARFDHLYFQYNYEEPVSAMVDWVIENHNVNQSNLVLWGVSLGGYLAPRAFAFEPRFSALIANGGVLDFYQVLVCRWPENLQQLYYANTEATDAALNAIFDEVIVSNEAPAFLQHFSDLDFGNTRMNLTQIFDAFMNFTLNSSDVLERFEDRPMYVYDPAWDTLTGNQSQLFWNAVPRKHPLSVIRQLDPRRGTALHCAVGSTANLLNDVSRWLRSTVKHE